jgi:predicted  nucleic acid-binding Zn-ribbon protein
MLLRTLEYHEDGLISLQQQFSRLVDKTDKQVYAFYESLPTKFFGLSVGLVSHLSTIVGLTKKFCIDC